MLDGTRMVHRDFSVAALCLFAMSQVYAEVVFFDSFESGDLSATNSDGFSWNHTNRTSIVIHDEQDGPVAIYNGNPIYNIHESIMPDGTVRDWNAVEGEHSLRFRYPEGINWAEQRFNMGKAYTEIWISFWVRVPNNYEHLDSDGTDNGKWFALWMDDYSSKGNGPTIVGSLEIVRELQDGKWVATGSTDLQMTWSVGGNTVTTPRSSRTRLIDFPHDQGRWMQWVIRAKAATTTESNDGIIQTWRRWQGEGGFTKLHDVTDADIGPPVEGPFGWQKGYLMGYMNSPFAVDTEFLLDNFTISTSSLLSETVPPSQPVLSIE